MSRGTQDLSYNPRKKIARQKRLSSRLQQVGMINYEEVDLVESDTDSELAVCETESGCGSVKS